jgi:hypothetical protein
MSDYQFTKDWFAWAPEVRTQIIHVGYQLVVRKKSISA